MEKGVEKRKYHFFGLAFYKNSLSWGHAQDDISKPREDTVRPKVGDLIEIDHRLLTSGPSLKWCRVLREENETKVYIKLGLILVFHMVYQFTYEAYR